MVDGSTLSIRTVYRLRIPPSNSGNRDAKNLYSQVVNRIPIYLTWKPDAELHFNSTSGRNWCLNQESFPSRPLQARKLNKCHILKYFTGCRFWLVIFVGRNLRQYIHINVELHQLFRADKCLLISVT